MNNRTEYKTDYDRAKSKLAYASAYEDECDLTIVEVRAIVDRIRTLEFENKELEEKLKKFQASNQTDINGETVNFPENANYK